jgi:predicted permease
MLNVKLALRTLFKSPFVTVIAIVSLALGIGANAAIFSLFNQLLLRPLPVTQPGQLVNFAAPGPNPGSQSCSSSGDCDEVFSYPMFKDLQRTNSSFSGIAAHRNFGANLAYKGQTIAGEGMQVSGSYFPVLGLQPALGRLLNEEDDRTVGESHVAVLGYGYWQTRFGRNPNVLNETLLVNGQNLTIVGVAPRGFSSTTLGVRPDVFVPITLRGLMLPGWKGFENRRSYWAYLFARLKPGVTLQQAHSAINVPFKAILGDVEAPLQTGMSAPTMVQFKAKELTLKPGERGQSSVEGQARAPMTLLLGVTAFVLLIACANIANLLLARAAKRANEMAVRLSIGASRWQLVVQLLTESCLLALFGGVAGLVVARWTLDLIVSLLPDGPAATLSPSLDGVVLAFAAALTLATGLLFGLFPALHSTRPDLLSTLKGNSGQPSGARNAARFRTSLATFQIAMSMTLLVSAGLFTKSLVNISRVDLGLNVDNVITFSISPELSGYTVQASKALFEQVEQALAAQPGVTGVTASRVRLLAGNNWGTDVSVTGFDKGPDTDANANTNEVSPGYFRTLGVPLIAGREFTRADTATAGKVAIINEEFARKFKLGRDAVGKWMGSDDDNKLDTQIVGVVQNAKYSAVKRATPPLFFRPYAQGERRGAMAFYVRTTLDPETFLATLPKVMAQLDPNLPIDQPKTMTRQINENVFLDRFISVLSAAFAILATLLAAVGLYGVLAYTISQRTREIGLRMALGAEPSRVRGMVLRQVGWMALIGGAIGLLAAAGVGRAAQSLLFELRGYDPYVLAGSAVALTLVALGAGFLPAQRASKIDPMRALRYD